MASPVLLLLLLLLFLSLPLPPLLLLLLLLFRPSGLCGTEVAGAWLRGTSPRSVVARMDGCWPRQGLLAEQASLPAAVAIHRNARGHRGSPCTSSETRAWDAHGIVVQGPARILSLRRGRR